MKGTGIGLYESCRESPQILLFQSALESSRASWEEMISESKKVDVRPHAFSFHKDLCFQALTYQVALVVKNHKRYWFNPSLARSHGGENGSPLRNLA